MSNLHHNMSYFSRILSKLSFNVSNLNHKVSNLKNTLSNVPSTTETHLNELYRQSNLVPNLSILAKETQNVVPTLTSLAKTSKEQESKEIVPNLTNIAKKSKDIKTANENKEIVPHLTILAKQSKEIVHHLTDMACQSDLVNQNILPHDLIHNSIHLPRQRLDFTPQSNWLEIETLVKADPPEYQPPRRVLGPPPGYDSNIPQQRKISHSPPPVYKYPRPPPSYVTTLNQNQRSIRELPRNVSLPTNREVFDYTSIRNFRAFMKESYTIYEFYKTWDRLDVSRAFVTSDLYEIPGLPRVHLFSPEHIPHYTVSTGRSARQIERIVNPHNITIKTELEVFNMAPKSNMYAAMVRFNQRDIKPESPVRKTRDGLLKPDNEVVTEKPLIRPLQTNCGCLPIPDVVPQASTSRQSEEERMLDQHEDLTIPSEKDLRYKKRPTSFPKPLVKVTISRDPQEVKKSPKAIYTWQPDTDKTEYHTIHEKSRTKPSLFIPSKSSTKNNDLKLTIEQDDDLLTVGYIPEPKHDNSASFDSEASHTKLKDAAEALTPKIENIKLTIESDDEFLESPVYKTNEEKDEEEIIYEIFKSGYDFETDPFETVYEPPESFREPKTTACHHVDDSDFSAHEADFDIFETLSKNYKSTIPDEMVYPSTSKANKYCNRSDTLPLSKDNDISFGIAEDNFKTGCFSGPKMSRSDSKTFTPILDDDFLRLESDPFTVSSNGNDSKAPVEFLAPHSYSVGFDDIHQKISTPKDKTKVDFIDETVKNVQTPQPGPSTSTEEKSQEPSKSERASSSKQKSNKDHRRKKNRKGLLESAI